MLNRRIRNFREDEGGFTLIELLVVILIIGILAAVALPTFLNQGKKGADAAAQSDVRAVATKVEACAAQTNDYSKCIKAATGAAGTLDPEAVTLPTGMTATVDGAAATYTLKETTNGKGNSNFWSVTSSNGNVSAPSGSAT